MPHRGAEGYDPYTIFNIEFVDPASTHIRITERSIINRFFSSQHENDIILGNPEFDQRFRLRGDKESNVKEILDPITCSKIMSLEFSSLEIGFVETFGLSDQQTSLLIASLDKIMRLTIHQGIEKMKKDAERFKYIMNTLIDIVEKIEEYSPQSN